MNKNELIAEYSTKNNVGKSDATKAVESLFDIITSYIEGWRRCEDCWFWNF